MLAKWGARREIRKKHAAEWARAPMKAKGVMPDQLAATPGWSRANERRALTAVGKRKGPAKAVQRAHRRATYGYDTLKLLIQLWKLAGRPSGKDLAALFETANPAELTRKIKVIQTRLIALAKDKNNAVTANGSRAKPAEARNQLSRAS
ncbi:MAG TPA: hypothetical protein VFD20_00975 [Demequina sp.]|nr:hypothetical protein [Demequina sp.]